MVLDSLPADVRAPTFLKLDIEGFELHALRGGKAWLSSHRPTYVWMELIPALVELSTGSNTAWLGVLSFWFDLEYRVWIPGTDGFEITREMLEEEMNGSSMIAEALPICSYNLMLSLLPIAEFAVPTGIPLDVCESYGPRTH